MVMACLQEGVYKEFEQAVADNVRKLKLGGGMDPKTTLGPLIAPGALERVRAALPAAYCQQADAVLAGQFWLCRACA